jgi:hypothetical protein
MKSRILSAVPAISVRNQTKPGRRGGAAVASGAAQPVWNDGFQESGLPGKRGVRIPFSCDGSSIAGSWQSPGDQWCFRRNTLPVTSP